MEFSKQQLIGLTGGIVLLLGVFLPVVSMPIMGSISVFSSGRVDGYILLGLAIISLMLSFVNKLKPLRITGGVSLVMVVFSFIYILFKLNSIKGDVADKLKDNPFSEMAQAMMSTVQIQYGWVFLFIGSLMLVYAAFVKNSNIDEQQIINVDKPLPVRKSSNTRLVAGDAFSHNIGKKAQLNDDGVEQRNCPDCRELIRFDARKCKHCGSMVEDV